MIPISRDPKRFVAALNKFRSRSLSLSLSAKLSCALRLPAGSTPFPSASLSLRSPSVTTQSVRCLSVRVESDVCTAAVGRAAEKEKDREGEKDSLPLLGPRTQDWWTGKTPQQCPGYSAQDGKLYSLPQLRLDAPHCTKEALQAYFDNTWTLTEVLLSALQGEDAFMRAPYHDLRHPMVFYYGHPAALYVNKLRVAGLLQQPVNAFFESIFETGVDEMSWDDLSKNRMPWPSVAAVRDYRREVYATVTRVIQGLSAAQCAAIDQQSPLWALVMGFEHERIHLETSSFLMNELPLRCVRFPEHWAPYHPSLPSLSVSLPSQQTTQEQQSPIHPHTQPHALTEAQRVRHPVAGEHFPQNEMVDVPAQRVSIGKPRAAPSFGWDNEYGHRDFDVPAFRASTFKVSNGEFHEFVRDSGYARRELWTETGWKWRAFRNVKWPTFWVRRGPQGNHEYDLRVLFDERPMPWSWPVCVNYHEAAAFAKWKALKTGKRLRVLTELEHRAIRSPVTQTGGDAEALEDDHAAKFGGPEMASQAGYNVNLAYSSMSPVDALPVNDKGFADVFGNAWEWTEDFFCPLPGFEVHPHYEDFSTPCFDGLHHVIMGGSFISTGNEASVHSRFHFRPHFYQHASFRLVEQLSDELVTSDTDAPGPFVGNYPFRRSTKSLQESARQSQHRDLNAKVCEHFGQLQGVFASLLSQNNNNNNKNNFKKNTTTYGAVKEQIVQAAQALAVPLNTANAIEVGCGPGGLTFLLAQHVQSVIGVDHHAEAVDFAKTLSFAAPVPVDGTAPQYTLRGEGELVRVCAVEKPLQVAKQVEFRCADPMCLPAEMKGFDLVVLHDVLDKVSAPNSVLGRLGGVRGLVRSGGMLAVLSAFEWDEQRTPKSLWLGGFRSPSGEVVRSEERLVERLSSEFEVHSSSQVPLLWQETEGTLRGKNLTVTIFKRK